MDPMLTLKGRDPASVQCEYFPFSSSIPLELNKERLGVKTKFRNTRGNLFGNGQQKLAGWGELSTAP
jgi:hypothetical protein